MLGSKTLGRVVVFGIGYVLGTRAGRQRYLQMQSGARLVLDRLRAQYHAEADADVDERRQSAREQERYDEYDGYDDITFGR